MAVSTRNKVASRASFDRSLPTPTLACAQNQGKAEEAGRALHMAVITLDKMAAGGMRDQLGGGFHRYSVDELFHVPHFEIMVGD